MSRIYPYIGVTGFMTGQEARFATRHFYKGFIPKRKLMIGVLVSSKTLSHKKDKWPGRYPDIDRIADIFPNHDTFNCIHYSTDEPDTLDRQLAVLTSYGGENLNGFQLNMKWPNPGKLNDALLYLMRATGKAYEVILQIGPEAFGEIEHDPAKLAKRLRCYNGIINAVLLDPSGGKGADFNANRMYEYLTIIRRIGPDIGVGVAGGLSDRTIKEKMPVLLKEFPDLSMDAEGRLRTASEDDLDLLKAKKYWEAAQSLVGD